MDTFDVNKHGRGFVSGCGRLLFSAIRFYYSCGCLLSDCADGSYTRLCLHPLPSRDDGNSTARYLFSISLQFQILRCSIMIYGDNKWAIPLYITQEISNNVNFKTPPGVDNILRVTITELTSTVVLTNSKSNFLARATVYCFKQLRL